MPKGFCWSAANCEGFDCSIRQPEVFERFLTAIGVLDTLNLVGGLNNANVVLLITWPLLVHCFG